MSVNKSTLIQSLIRILDNHEGWMEFESLCLAVLPEIGRKRVTDALRDEIESMLNSAEGIQDLVLLRPSEKVDDEDEYICRRHFFEGTRFLVNFTPFEQKQEVLVPGHRFLPFIPSTLPADAIPRYKGKPLKTKTIKIPFNDTHTYHMLIGRTGWRLTLMRDNSLEELEKASVNNEPVNLTVFDLKPVFKDVPNPRQLLLRCSNYHKHEVDIIEVKRENQAMDSQAVKDGVAALDLAFFELFVEYGPDDLSLTDQIAYAYARLPDWFFEAPPFYLGAYLQLSDKVSLFEDTKDTILWISEEAPEEGADLDLQEVYDAVEKILEDREISPEELVQNIFDDLFHREDEPSEYRSDDWPAPATQRALMNAPRSEQDLDNKVYRLKVALEVDKSIYRIIDVHSANLWSELHEVIFEAFDRFDPHLYSFFFPGKPTKSERKRIQAPQIGIPEEGGGPDDAECVMIGEVPLEKGATFYYLFDWGDCWWHEIKVQSATDSETESEVNFPAIVKSVGISPEQYS